MKTTSGLLDNTEEVQNIEQLLTSGGYTPKQFKTTPAGYTLSIGQVFFEGEEDFNRVKKKVEKIKKDLINILQGTNAKVMSSGPTWGWSPNISIYVRIPRSEKKESKLFLFPNSNTGYKVTSSKDNLNITPISLSEETKLETISMTSDAFEGLKDAYELEPYTKTSGKIKTTWSSVEDRMITPQYALQVAKDFKVGMKDYESDVKTNFFTKEASDVIVDGPINAKRSGKPDGRGEDKSKLTPELYSSDNKEPIEPVTPDDLEPDSEGAPKDDSEDTGSDVPMKDDYEDLNRKEIDDVVLPENFWDELPLEGKDSDIDFTKESKLIPPIKKNVREEEWISIIEEAIEDLDDEQDYARASEDWDELLDSLRGQDIEFQIDEINEFLAEEFLPVRLSNPKFVEDELICDVEEDDTMGHAGWVDDGQDEDNDYNDSTITGKKSSFIKEGESPEDIVNEYEVEYEKNSYDEVDLASNFQNWLHEHYPALEEDDDIWNIYMDRYPDCFPEYDSESPISDDENSAKFHRGKKFDGEHKGHRLVSFIKSIINELEKYGKAYKIETIASRYLSESQMDSLDLLGDDVTSTAFAEAIEKLSTTEFNSFTRDINDLLDDLGIEPFNKGSKKKVKSIMQKLAEGEPWILESEDEIISSDEFNEQLILPALDGDKESQDFLSQEIWQGESWKQIEKKLKDESSAWYVWYMDGVRTFMKLSQPRNEFPTPDYDPDGEGYNDDPYSSRYIGNSLI